MLRETGFLLLVIFGCSVGLPSDNRQTRAAVCGYESCAAVDPDKLNVHIVAHSHTDPGGHKTWDQYYYGTRNDVHNAGVQYILDTVVASLEDNPDRKFIFVETSYFWKWYEEQDEYKQLEVRTMVSDGRLEFVGGGLSMDDEATTHYYSIIDNLTWGLKRLTDTFGECGRPRVGWQIDTFGHSKTMASILAEMGYDGLFLGRLDYMDKENRLNAKNAEMVWEGSSINGASSDLFTTVLSNSYESPPGFCFDTIQCSVVPIIDDTKSPDYNVPLRVTEFLEYVSAQAEYYNTNNILVTMGGDFHYQDAQSNFKNLDKLIRYVNEADDNVNVIYSTPSCYLKAVNDAGKSFNTKQDDFFPYAFDAHSYWTGFYTSRPAIKYLDRLGNGVLQVAKQLGCMALRVRTETNGRTRLNKIKDGMGVLQDHQGITGTVKQNVADDIMRRSSNAIEDGRIAGEISVNEILALNDYVAGQQRMCLELNVSKCEHTETRYTDQSVVTVYNPLSHTINHTVRIPVLVGTYLVQDPEANGQDHEFLPVPESVLVLPEREGYGALYDMVFMAYDLAPMSLRTYYFRKISEDFLPVYPTSDTFIGDESLRVNMDEETGFVRSIVSNGEEFPLDQKFYYYRSYAGENTDSESRSSGPYVFRPEEQEAIQIGNSAYYEVYKGTLVEEIHQLINPWVRQVIRIYKGQNNVEFEWLVGPIPVDDGYGKEVITRYTTNLETNGVFYTDANGREFMERRRDYRPTWDLDVTEPVAANYYPVTSTILLKDAENAQELAVLTDRAQGGTSLNDGQVELMVHRRLLHDDGFGVGEALNELEYDTGLVIRGKHYVMIGRTDGASPTFAAQRRQTAVAKLFAPWYFVSPTSVDFVSWNNVHDMEYAGMNQDLPPNIIIHSLEPWDETTLLIRLEHILEPDDDPELSQPVTVNFEEIFTPFTVTSVRETTLDGNRFIEDMNRLVWNYNSSSTGVTRDAATISPMEIKTYVIEIERRE